MSKQPKSKAPATVTIVCAGCGRDSSWDARELKRLAKTALAGGVNIQADGARQRKEAGRDTELGPFNEALYQFWSRIPGITDEQARRVARGTDPRFSPEQAASFSKYIREMDGLTCEQALKAARGKDPR